jgi:hypothetical protein
MEPRGDIGVGPGTSAGRRSTLTGTARRKLKALRQTGPASSYLDKLSIRGDPRMEGPDQVIDQAIEGRKSHLKDEIARQGNVPKTLDELIGFIVPLDNRLYEREQERNGKETRFRPSGPKRAAIRRRRLPPPPSTRCRRGPSNPSDFRREHPDHPSPNQDA